MASTPKTPTLQPHHAYRSWTSTWYDENGQRHFKRFGKETDTTAAMASARFTRWLKEEWGVKPKPDPNTYAVRDLCTAYAAVAQKRYTKHGKLTSHIDQVEAGLNALMQSHGDDPAEDIGSPQLTKLVATMAASKDFEDKPRQLAVSTVNGRLRVIKQAYRWAYSQKLVSRDAMIGVYLTDAVRARDGIAKPPKIVRPVPQDVLDKTLAVCPQTVADMIRVQLVTGMRPGELCNLRACDIDARDKRCWVYRPWTHKSEHKGKSRTIFIGPRAQKILKPYLAKRATDEQLFLPAEAHRERLEMIGFAAVTAYQMSRSVFKPGRVYVAGTYRNAISHACDRAFDPKGEKRALGDYSHRWHPHRLRHNFATSVRETAGVEAASIMLGHANVSTTEIYAEKSEKVGRELARKVG